MEQTASNEPPSPERERSRSPPPAIALVDEAVSIARRTCPVCVRVFDSPKAMWGHSWVHREKKDHIVSLPPPPPLGGGLLVGSGDGPATVAAAAPGGSGWHPWKIDSKDDRDRTCPKCSKMFASPKAMFGHLHVHYERSPAKRAKGESSSSNQPAPVVVVEAVRPVNVVVPEGGGGREDGDSPVSIDLNRPVCMEEDVKGGEGSPASSGSSIDLNKPPRS